MNLTIFFQMWEMKSYVVRGFWQYLSRLILCFNLAVLLKSINYCGRNKCSWWTGSKNVIRSSCEREFWHKRLYHMYSDVIFGWVVWIWLSISHFVLSILILKRRTEPEAEPRGPSGLVTVPPTTPGKFETDGENKIKIFRTNCEILSQIHTTQPKITSLYMW